MQLPLIAVDFVRNQRVLWRHFFLKLELSEKKVQIPTDMLSSSLSFAEGRVIVCGKQRVSSVSA